MPNDFPDFVTEIRSPRKLLGTISVGPGATSPVNNFPIGAGVLAFAFQAISTVGPLNVEVIGHNTGVIYYNDAPGTNFIQRDVEPSVDASLDVTVTSPLGNSTQVSFYSVTTGDAVYVRNALNEPVPVQPGVQSSATAFAVHIQDQINTTQASVYSSVGGSGVNALAVQLIGAPAGAPPSVFSGPAAKDLAVVQKDPEPWQYPTNTAYRETVGPYPVTLVAGIGGQRIRIFGYGITSDPRAGNNFADMFDSVLGNPNGRFAALWVGGNTTFTITGWHGGLPLSLGASVQLDASDTTQNTRFWLSYSQF